MAEIKFTAQQKEGNKYIDKRTETDPAKVYKSLAGDLINKKLVGASWITRIIRKRRYDGMQTIIVTYDNGWRTVYEVENRI